MAHLHNRIEGKVLKEKLAQAEKLARTTISFYKYHNLTDPAQFRNDLYKQLENLGVLGRIYVAHEGINAQISVPSENFEAFKTELYSITFLNGVRLNIAVDDNGKSFFKLKILVRKINPKTDIVRHSRIKMKWLNPVIIKLNLTIITSWQR